VVSLNAVVELVDLPGGKELFYAPWRDDPRPLLGLLHGIYAFTAVHRIGWWLHEFRPRLVTFRQLQFSYHVCPPVRCHSR